MKAQESIMKPIIKLYITQIKTSAKFTYKVGEKMQEQSKLSNTITSTNCQFLVVGDGEDGVMREKRRKPRKNYSKRQEKTKL